MKNWRVLDMYLEEGWVFRHEADIDLNDLGDEFEAGRLTEA